MLLLITAVLFEFSIEEKITSPGTYLNFILWKKDETCVLSAQEISLVKKKFDIDVQQSDPLTTMTFEISHTRTTSRIVRNSVCSKIEQKNLRKWFKELLHSEMLESPLLSFSNHGLENFSLIFYIPSSNSHSHYLFGGTKLGKPFTVFGFEGRLLLQVMLINKELLFYWYAIICNHFSEFRLKDEAMYQLRQGESINNFRNRRYFNWVSQLAEN